MEANLIDLNHYAVKATLKTLLQDKTTKKNIIWATTSYDDKGPEYQDTKQIQIGSLIGMNPHVSQNQDTKHYYKQQYYTNCFVLSLKSDKTSHTHYYVCEKQ